MDKPEETPQQKIVLAAIDCVEKSGIEGATIRNIASRAGVNSAAINYYFRSKEKLLEEVMRATAEHSLSDLESLVKAGGDDPVELLTKALNYILEGAVRFPNLTKAHLYEALTHGSYKGPFFSRFNELLSGLAARIRDPKKADDPETVALKLIEAVSGVVFAALLPKMYKRFAGLDFAEPEARKAYLAIVVRQFFA